MKAERLRKEPQKAELIQSKRENAKLSFVDYRPLAASQMKLVNSIKNQEKETALCSNLESGQKDNYLPVNDVLNKAAVVQGYFVYNGKRLSDKQAESLHGWAHVNLNDTTRIEFLKLFQDKKNLYEVTEWFYKKNIPFAECVFEHLTHWEMGMLEVRRNELIFEIMHDMHYDCMQSCIPGIDKLVDDITRVDTTKRASYSFLEGYAFQVQQIIKEADKSEYLETEEGDILMENVKKVESSYTDINGTTRWADMEVVDSDDEERTAYIEVKAISSSYNPDEATKKSFDRQAYAYSRCGKKVTYIFKNDPPAWIKEILVKYKLNFKMGA